MHRLLQPLLALEQEQQRGLVKLSAQLERVHIVPEARGQPAPRTFGGIANLKVRIETKNVNHLDTMWLTRGAGDLRTAEVHGSCCA